MAKRRDVLKVAAASVLSPTTRALHACAVGLQVRREQIYVHAQLSLGAQELRVVAGIIAIEPAESTWTLLRPETRDFGLLELRISPDATRYASVRRVAGEPTSSLIVGTLSGEVEPKVVAEDLSRPIWSHDGESLIASRRSRRPKGGIRVETFRLNKDGSDRRPMPMAETDEVTDRSADGGWLVGYAHQPPRDDKSNWPLEIVVMRPDGGERRIVASDQGKRLLFPAIAPDGKFVSYIKPNRNGSRALWIAPIEGKEPTKLMESTEQGIMESCWSPDGRKLVVVLLTQRDQIGEDREYHLAIVDARSGDRELLPLPSAVAMGSPNWV